MALGLRHPARGSISDNTDPTSRWLSSIDSLWGNWTVTTAGGGFQGSLCQDCQVARFLDWAERWTSELFWLLVAVVGCCRPVRSCEGACAFRDTVTPTNLQSPSNSLDCICPFSSTSFYALHYSEANLGYSNIRPKLGRKSSDRAKKRRHHLSGDFGDRLGLELPLALVAHVQLTLSIPPTTSCALQANSRLASFPAAATQPEATPGFPLARRPQAPHPSIPRKGRHFLSTLLLVRPPVGTIIIHRHFLNS
ncbi:hypothetical protein VTJ04DRAFT_3739 [Mycothermus thermophilus]|uniref:uncharacterized protein n=1 Tax=Humicola insolens TaxID=85995 RepID=UPI003744A572